METIIKVKNLSKNYGSFKAVKDISFEVESGSLFAFLGPNGAGKSTTINILSTLITQNAGYVTINNWQLGKDDEQIRKNIGVVFQTSVLDDSLTVKENLIVRGSFYGLEGHILEDRIKEASEITKCDEFLNRRYGKLSGGQKRRADIARALINKPKLLFLDEPTTGLDPKTRISVWQTIKDMQEQSGMTVFLTTHYMEEAVNADRITIISKGEIIAEGNPHDLKEQYTKELLKIYHPTSQVMNYLTENKVSYVLDKEAVLIEVTTAVKAITILADLKTAITSFEMIQGSMDDVFLNVIKESQEAK